MITKEQIREILSLHHDTYLMHCVGDTSKFPINMEQHRLRPAFFDDWVVDYIYNNLPEDYIQEKNKSTENKEQKPDYAHDCQDYKEITDKAGRTWYQSCHWHAQRDESRKLKRGDAIIYRRDNFPEGVYGIMIINSFDVKTDFAARAYIGKAPYVSQNGKQPTVTYTIYGEYAPCMDEFSFATDEEIKTFIQEIKADKHSQYYVDTMYKFFPDYMHQYDKFINE